MIRLLVIGLGLSAYLMSPTAHAAESHSSCPVTMGSDQTLGAPFGESKHWYGSESLAVMLPPGGKWGVTGPTARIAVKLFLWSQGFEPGMEQHLSINIESMDGQDVDAVVKDVTNARPINGEISAMLAGIDFPSAGCWRITAEYLGQTLSFVVETVELEEQ